MSSVVAGGGRVAAALQPLSAGASGVWESGVPASPLGDPFFWGLEHQLGTAPEREAESCPLPGGPGGCRTPSASEGSQRWG